MLGLTRPRAEPGAPASEPWYVAEGKRGQRLLDQGEVDRAAEVFAAILARQGDAPSYGRAVVLGRLGRCFHMRGQPEPAVRHLREALVVLGRLAPSDGVKSLRGTLRSELGDALRAGGECGDARKAYEAALKIAEELQDRRAQSIELGRLGSLALALGQPEVAEGRYRKAVEVERQIGNPISLVHHLGALADVLRHQPGRLVEARQLIAEALRIAQTVDPAGAEVWQTYGILAGVTEQEAAATADDERRAALQRQAYDFRQLQQYPPRILATLAGLGAAPSSGRAVMLGQLGRCFQMSRRPDLAAARLREAIEVTGQLPPGGEVSGLCGMLHLELGDALRASGRDGEARTEYEAALKIAAALQDLRGQAAASQRLGRPFLETPVPDRVDRPVFEVTLYEGVITDYVFGTDLLIDGPRERRIIRMTGEPAPLGAGVRPMLVPCARSWMDDDGAIRFSLPPGEPIVEPDSACTVMRRTCREVTVSGNPEALWRLIRGMDGASTVAEILSGGPAGERAVAARMLATLAAGGVIDVSGRPIARFIHAATKKGVLPAGGLEGAEVLRLATDGDYRAYPGTSRLTVGESVPDRLRAFHELTRARRSRRNYAGLALTRGDFDALLHTACGVTGAMPWAGREVKLRAYPSSGALYAVEIYPIVFRVDGLGQAVYHYRAVENVLEVVRPEIDRARVVAAALPVEQEMVAGAAALFCLAGVFPRHERKYGEGGYRMMVAEAGHISQNLILAATALGLAARPFGGVFDGVLNHDLGLDGAEEQFLLGVLVGHAGG